MKIEDDLKGFYTSTKLVDGCCETMRLAVEEWCRCTPHINYYMKDSNSDYEDGFYICGCDDKMPIPIKFCPWCGKEIK